MAAESCNHWPPHRQVQGKTWAAAHRQRGGCRLRCMPGSQSTSPRYCCPLFSGLSLTAPLICPVDPQWSPASNVEPLPSVLVRPRLQVSSEEHHLAGCWKAWEPAVILPADPKSGCDLPKTQLLSLFHPAGMQQPAAHARAAALRGYLAGRNDASISAQRTLIHHRLR